jgi:hypothetical protein
MIFLGGIAFGYSQAFALAIRRQRSQNYRVRADGDDRLRAEEKGAALLRSWLSPEQAKLWDSHRHFYVVGSDTGRRYRIKYQSAAPVLFSALGATPTSARRSAIYGRCRSRLVGRSYAGIWVTTFD